MGAVMSVQMVAVQNRVFASKIGEFILSHLTPSSTLHKFTFCLSFYASTLLQYADNGKSFNWIRLSDPGLKPTSYLNHLMFLKYRTVKGLSYCLIRRLDRLADSVSQQSQLGTAAVCAWRDSIGDGDL